MTNIFFKKWLYCSTGVQVQVQGLQKVARLDLDWTMDSLDSFHYEDNVPCPNQ